MRASTFWGTVLVLAGALFLLNSLGLLAINAWNLILPLFLIAVGIWVLWGAFFARGPMGQEAAAIPLEGAARARVYLSHGAGRLIARGGAAPDQLLEGTFGGGLEHRAHRSSDRLDVEMRMRPWGFGAWGPWSWTPGALEWEFRLNGTVPLEIELETGAGETRLDLVDLKVTDLTVRTGASSTEIVLPSSAGQTHVRVNAGAASVVLRVPDGVAGRVRVRGGLAGKTIDTGRFPRAGSAYESPDYASAANKVDIEAEIDAGSIEVR